MNTQQWQTSVEEIANIIFNTADAELNDILTCIVNTRRYDVRSLFDQITLSINGSIPYHLRSELTTGMERRQFLQEKIKLELTYYAIQSELVSSHRRTGVA